MPCLIEILVIGLIYVAVKILLPLQVKIKKKML